MEDRKGHDTAYDWKNHVDLAPYAGLPQRTPQQMDGLRRAQEALAKAEAGLAEMNRAIYADGPSKAYVPEPVLTLTARTTPACITISVGKGQVTLQENSDGYLDAAASGCGLSEAAEVFFNEVIACHALALGKLRRERDELVAALVAMKEEKAREREACVPEHLIPDRGVKGF